VTPNVYEQDITINLVPTRKVEAVKKNETEVAKTTTCPKETKTCLMTEDGQQKYGQFENQVPVGAPLTTTTAENESKCADLCQSAAVCNSASYNSKDKACALFAEKWSGS
jgi:cell wall assembly regulator SMI1